MSEWLASPDAYQLVLRHEMAPSAARAKFINAIEDGRLPAKLYGYIEGKRSSAYDTFYTPGPTQHGPIEIDMETGAGKVAKMGTRNQLRGKLTGCLRLILITASRSD